MKRHPAAVDAGLFAAAFLLSFTAGYRAGTRYLARHYR